MVALRPIAPIAAPDVERGQSDAPPPILRVVDPACLLVDDSYQRSLSERSVSLIRRIIANWDWRAFKPPIVTETAEGLHVLDGQHTAIAAVTHGGIGEIPVLVVTAPAAAHRAEAFVRHNRDRIQVTQHQIHHAMVAAGDEDALTIEQVCARAGVRLLRMPPYGGDYEIGDCMALGAIKALVARRYAAGARRVLDVLVEAKLAPIPAAAIKAVEYLLFEEPYRNELAAGDVATALRAKGAHAEREARLIAIEQKVPIWRAMVTVLAVVARGRRRGR